MMEKLICLLDERAEAFRIESSRLTADDRGDEGNLAKVRANVYGICKSVFQVLPEGKAAEKLQSFYREWESARFAAQNHGDESRVTIETVKLETLEEVLALLEGKGR